MNGTPLIYTEHATTRMALRKIPRDWIERVVAQPELIEQDPDDSEVELFYGSVPEFGNRVLLVVVNTHVAPRRVVTVFFDSRMRGQL